MGKLKFDHLVDADKLLNQHETKLAQNSINNSNKKEIISRVTYVFHPSLGGHLWKRLWSDVAGSKQLDPQQWAVGARLIFFGARAGLPLRDSVTPGNQN